MIFLWISKAEFMRNDQYPRVGESGYVWDSQK